MSESFDEVCTSYGDCTWIGRDEVNKVIARLQMAHEREIAEALCDACDQCDRVDKKAYEHEIEHLRKAAYHRGYEDGRRSKDADHAAVAMRLQRLRFDGGSLENLNKIAYAIYPCATGWTVESCDGLRDRIIDLLGGVHDGVPDYVPCRACGDDCHCGDGQQEAIDVDDSVSDVRADVPAAGGMGDLAAAQVTYDVLGNERHKAICELRSINDSYMTTGDATQFVCDMANAINAEGCDSETIYKGVRERLIHLLGGDEPYSNHTRTILEPNLPKSAETIKSEGECDGKIMENGENHQIEATITDELREFKGRINAVLAPEMVLALRAEINCIADRIDEQERKLRKQRDGFKKAMVAAQDLLEKRTDERDKLQKVLDEMREQREHWADEATKMYRLFFSHDEYCVPDSPSEMVAAAVGKLQAKLDAIREALDG